MYKLLLSAILLTTTLLSVNSESFQFCVNESINYTEFGENVHIASPGYPEQYDRSKSCGLALFLPTHIPAVLHITQYIPTTADCSVPYVIADSRSFLLPNQYKSCSQKDDLNIYNNVVPILSNEQPSAQLILSVAAGLADGFKLNLTVTRDEAVNKSTTASSTVQSATKTTITSVSRSSSNAVPFTVSRPQPFTSVTQSATFTSHSSLTKSRAKTTTTNPGTWIAIGAGIGTFLLIVVAIILGCILGRRYKDRLSSKRRANMNAYEESDLIDQNPNRPTSGRVGVNPSNQYSDIDLSAAPANEMEDRNHYWEIEHTNDRQTNSTSEPTTERDVSVGPTVSDEQPAAERIQTAPVYSRIQKAPIMIDNSLYEIS